jgi:hypothetical protein
MSSPVSSRLAALGLLASLLLAEGGARAAPRRPDAPAPGGASSGAARGPNWFNPQGKTENPSQAEGRRKRQRAEEAARAKRVVPAVRADRPRLNRESPLGTNLEAPGLEGRDWVFLDLFKMSTPWAATSRLRADDRGLDVDPSGWVRSLLPDQVAVTRMPTLGGGTYVLLYEGRGELEVEGATRIDGVTPGRMVLELPAYGTLTLTLQTSNLEDPVRNIRVVPANFEGSHNKQVFHPLFLRRLARFSVLRFAGWSRIDSARVSQWDDRPRWEHATQGSPKGVAYEYMIMLANELGADMWINIPHEADDDFVDQLARLIALNLEPDLKVYVEYSSELWRAPQEREQAAFARRQGVYLGLAGDPRTALLRFQARRSAEIFRLFGQALGSPDRLVRVVSGQAGAVEDHEELLAFEDLARNVDALAIDVHFGAELSDPMFAAQLASGGASWALDQLEDESVPATLARIRESSRVARKRKVALVAYSGGQALTADPVSPDAASMAAYFRQANESARMKSTYLALLSGWQSNGGELFMHSAFVTPAGARGQPGALDYVDQPMVKTPKYDALLTFADNYPRWWTERRPAPVSGDGGVVALTEQGPPGGASGLPSVVAPSDGAASALSSVARRLDNNDRTLKWVATGATLAGVAGALAGSTFYLRATSQRDRLIAESFSPADGTEARRLDEEGFRWSIATIGGLGLAGFGVGTAIVLGLSSEDDLPQGALPESLFTQPSWWLAAGTGALGLVGGGTFILSFRQVSALRDEKIAKEPSPASSAPIRALDNEALAWSTAAAVSIGVGVVGATVAGLRYLLRDVNSTYGPEDYLDAVSVLDAPSERRRSSTREAGAQVFVLPDGLLVRW